MDRQSLKEFTFGGLSELMHNKKYYYSSGIGPQYSHWTEDGQKALTEFLNLMAFKILEVEEAELNQRAKDLVVKGLKGEKV